MVRFGVAWNYTPFHQGSIAAMKYSRNRNEAAVNVQKWIGYLWGRVLFLNDNNNGLNGNNNLNNNGRFVGIVKLTMLGLLLLLCTAARICTGLL